MKGRFSNVRHSVKSPKASFSDVSESDLIPIQYNKTRLIPESDALKKVASGYSVTFS